MKRSSIGSRLLVTVAFLVCANRVSAQGVYIHSVEGDKIAQQAKTNFTQASSGDSNVFATMLSNTIALRDQTIEQLYVLSQESARSNANRIPLMTWREVVVDVVSRQQEFLTAYQTAAIAMHAAPTEVHDLQTAVTEANRQTNQLSKQATEEKSSLSAETAKLSDMKDSLSKLKTGLQETSKIHKLSDLKGYKEFSQIWNGNDSAKDWLSKAEKATGGPGEQLAILDLAVQLHTNAVKQLQLEEQATEARLRDAQMLSVQLMKAVGSGKVDGDGRLREGDFGKVYRYLVPCAAQDCPSHPFVDSPDQQVLTTIGLLAEKANKEVGSDLNSTLALQNLMDVIARYSSLVGYERFLLLKEGIDDVTDEQLLAVRMSAVNADSRAQLIRHGLEGIATYEAGGITPDDVANVFRAAQTAASGVIAGRIP
jgi:hypothetical protein